MYAQDNHQNGMAHIEVDYPYCKIHPMEPLQYQSLAQRKMEVSNEFYFLAELHDERLLYNNHWSNAGSYDQY